MTNQAPPSLDIRPASTDDHGWLYYLHENSHRGLVEPTYGPWEEAQQRDLFTPSVNGHEVFILSDGDTARGRRAGHRNALPGPRRLRAHSRRVGPRERGCAARPPPAASALKNRCPVAGEQW